MRSGGLCSFSLILILLTFVLGSGCTVTDQQIGINLTNLTVSYGGTLGLDSLGELGNQTVDLLQKGLETSLSVVNSTLGNVASQ